jgi:hypothetical protein
MTDDDALGVPDLVDGLKEFRDIFGCEQVSATYRAPSGLIVTMALSGEDLLTVSDSEGTEYVVRLP